MVLRPLSRGEPAPPPSSCARPRLSSRSDSFAVTTRFILKAIRVPEPGTFERKSLVNEAAARFHADDERAFLHCFDSRVRVFTDPSQTRPQLGSREELRDWHARIRSANPGLSATLTEIQEHGRGVVADLAVVLSRHGHGENEGWRVSLAFGFNSDLIDEVRPFWQRDAALRSLVDS